MAATTLVPSGFKDPKQTWNPDQLPKPVGCKFSFTAYRDVLGFGQRCRVSSGGHMRRREVITLLGGATVGWPLLARAQQPSEGVVKIGVLWPGFAPPASPRMESFRLALRQFGYVEGRNVAIELRYAEGGVGQLPELAAELVRLKVNVITAFGDLAPRMAQQATATIPIVAICDDILGAGLVTSLS